MIYRAIVALGAIFARLFGLPKPIDRLLNIARTYGDVSVQSTILDEGAGWVCYIRPADKSSRKDKWAVQSWGGQGVTLREAIDSAIDAAVDQPAAHFDDDDVRCKPKLGGRGYEKP